MDRRSCCAEYVSAHGPGPFFGRLLISLIFILAGISKIFDFQSTSEALRNMGIQKAEIFIVIAILMELIGGILLLLGWHTRAAIYILMIFLLPTTLIFHSFWHYQGAEMKVQLSNFLKNLTIYGGLLLLLSYGPGRWSVDALRE